MTTQMEYARQGFYTDEMRFIAEVEGLDVEDIRRRVAEGFIVIPANRRHTTLKRPCGIGQGLTTKVNANIGTSYDYVNEDEELEKARVAVQYGADTVMDLSTGGDLEKIRQHILEATPVPLGTVPIYEAEYRAVAERGSFLKMTVDDLFNTIEAHGRQGVDYITVHCGITRHALELYRNQSRTTGIVSRGGGLMAAWMLHNDQENPLWKHFDWLLEIAREYDMVLSLGDSLRPGSLADDLDRPQVEELVVLGDLVERARNAGVQTMVEGPGHVPLNEIQTNVQLQKKLCKDAPFYILGMLAIDTGAGFDHISGAIGGAVAAMYGVDMLCYVTPAEHLALPTVDEVREGVIAFKIAAHAGDYAKGIPQVRERNRKLSEARYRLDWEEQFRLLLFPDVAREIFTRRASKTRACSMCGPYCPMNLVEKVLAHEEAKSKTAEESYLIVAGKD